MILVKLIGGLGNQMHQYAFGKLVANRLNEELYFETNDIAYNNKKKKFASRELLLGNVFDLQEPLRTKADMPEFINFNPLLRKIFSNIYLFSRRIKSQIEEFPLETDNLYAKITPDTFLKGTWVAYKTLQKERKDVLSFFRFKEKITSKFVEFKKSCYEQQSVAIHIRRGDYLWQQHKDFNICSLDYYREAVSVIRQQIETPSFYVFSDDQDWCKENLDFFQKGEVIYVDFNNADNPGEDLYCMSCCKHFIIPMSTFSYWGAFLSEHASKTVIAPQKWIELRTAMFQSSGWIWLNV
jgi:hypothetical protein